MHYEFNNYQELFRGMKNQDVRFHQDKWIRIIHNYPDGNYWNNPNFCGRHSTCLPSKCVRELHVVWLGFYPMNEHLLARKLQIKKKIPQSDSKMFRGLHHQWDQQRICEELIGKAGSGTKLEEINPSLYKIISEI